MIQIVGGIAAAGAVAAGATAFTASGVLKDASVASGVAVGGSVSITANEGAKVMSMKVKQTAADPDQLTGVEAVVVAADGSTSLPNSAVVKAKISGTGGTAGAVAWSSCTKATDTYTCNLSGYYTAITAVEIAMIPYTP
uniref:hypothetical protein n=1 Tax=Paractinoplanes polyasparticus TaxID=2856853 RepID=UPI001C852098|nr:hypothetical protein [Actinoplanes polyasparticus]